MYWTDWSYSDNSSINWLSMDGSESGTLLSDDHLQWPNGLALVPSKNSSDGSGTLYWTDAFYDTIESISTDGQGRKVGQYVTGMITSLLLLEKWSTSNLDLSDFYHETRTCDISCHVYILNLLYYTMHTFRRSFTYAS